MNQYDEMKSLLDASRKMLGKDNLNETRETLKSMGLLNEQEEEVVTDLTDDPVNIAADIEDNIESTSNEDRSESYRVSGGIITLHGKTKQDVELSTDEKLAYQETMQDFVDQVSDLSDFGTLHLYPNNVEWSGKVIDFDLEFFYSIGENNGVYVNGDMIKLDESLVELINKLTSFYEQFKSKWAKVLSQRKKTKNVETTEE
tara:strand:+ start:1453 stop:2055 length:603 start_codon:yes stop_codon:yes gene_type:complete